MVRHYRNLQTKTLVKSIFYFIFLLVVAGIGIKLFWPGNAPDRACGPANGQTCQVFYLLNLDGMKGLGHSSLMLVDEDGAGRIFQMHRSKWICSWPDRVFPIIKYTVTTAIRRPEN